jgi:hypothetical protein
MFNASDLKRGDVVKIDGDPHIVETVKVQTPSARGAMTLYKIRFRNLKTKRKVDQSLHGNDVLAEADFERRPVQYLFGDASSITFMTTASSHWPGIISRTNGSTSPRASKGLSRSLRRAASWVSRSRHSSTWRSSKRGRP